MNFLPGDAHTTTRSLMLASIGANAHQLLTGSAINPSLFTSVSQLNLLLGGGFRTTGGIYDLCGVPGSGKTQLCMQFCADVQVPKNFGGLGGKVIYIDTEGSFDLRRFAEIATGVATNLSNVYANMIKHKMSQKKFRSRINDPGSVTAAHDIENDCFLPPPTAQNIVDGITLLKVYDSKELQDVIKYLFEYLLNKTDDGFKNDDGETKNENERMKSNISLHNTLSNKSVKLIVIDSLSFHLRYSFGDRMAERASYILQLGCMLNKLASIFKLAIIVTNHMTTKLASGGGGKVILQENIIPALGESWANIPLVRFLLDWADEYATPVQSPLDAGVNKALQKNENQAKQQRKRCIKILKSDELIEGKIYFYIFSDGVRSC